MVTLTRGYQIAQQFLIYILNQSQPFVPRLGKPLADKLTAGVEPTVYKKLEIA